MEESIHIAGLTGGTGAGKSCAAARFAAHGIGVIDADAVGHALIAPGGAAVAEVIARFGSAIAPCGKISRAKLGALVFNDPQALEALNAIMKPRIFTEIAHQCAALAESGRAVAMVDAALLGDQGSLEPWLDSLVLVSSPESSRVARLVANRGWSEAMAWERVRAQVDPESKRPLARWVVENDGTLDAFLAQVDEVAGALLATARRSSDGAL
jgi:dephospho-CoA kinase